MEQTDDVERWGIFEVSLEGPEGGNSFLDVKLRAQFRYRNEGLEPIDFGWDVTCAGKEGEYYLAYFGIHQPAFRSLNLPDGWKFKIDIIDTWEMTISPVRGAFEGECEVKLSGKPYIALRIRKEGVK